MEGKLKEYIFHILLFDKFTFKIIHSVLISFLFLFFFWQMFVNLRILNFDRCEGLTQIPDVSGLPNLEEFSFECCFNLITVHNSIGFLDKLKILNAFRCKRLRSFPPIKLTSLEKLNLSFCYSLESFPEILGKMENIRELYLLKSSIKEIPFSFQNLTGLPKLPTIFFKQCNG